MNLDEKNQEIIKRLDELIKEVDLNAIESDIMNGEVDVRVLYKKRENSFWALLNNVENVYYLNAEKIESNPILKEAFLSWSSTWHYDVTHMNQPYNRDNYIVKLFYEKLEHKYKNNVGLMLTSGLYYGKLKPENLDDEERKEIDILTKYMEISLITHKAQNIINWLDIL